MFLDALIDATTPPGAPRRRDGATWSCDAALPSYFAVTELAADAHAAACLALMSSHDPQRGAAEIDVDARLASLWFKRSLVAEGWSPPPPWDPISGDYRAADGWLRIHANAPTHRSAAKRALGLPVDAERDAVAAVVKSGAAEALETAIVDAGGAAARMRTAEEWAQSAPGAAVAADPLVIWDAPASCVPDAGQAADPAAPLQDVRVLDLTRVLAGPSATRFLAGFGADVLRIDPSFWNEPALEAEMTLGKRCAGLDLREPADRAVFERLLTEADILVHGYRDGALAGLGFDLAARRALNPRLIDIGLNAYGWSGPWRGRRGFDSLVQMSSGIAAHGMVQAGSGRPTPLPAQALDYGAGMVLAASALTALAERRRVGAVHAARTSLAAMAHLLRRSARGSALPLGASEITEPRPDEIAPEIEATAFGPARRLRFPASPGGAQPIWRIPAGVLRRDPPHWSKGPAG